MMSQQSVDTSNSLIKTLRWSRSCDESLAGIREEEEMVDVFLSKEALHANKSKCWLVMLKRIALIAIIVLCSCTLMVKNEHVDRRHYLSVPANDTIDYIITEPMINEHVQITLKGALLPHYYDDLSPHSIRVWLQLIETSYRPKNASQLLDSDIRSVTNISDLWMVPIVVDRQETVPTLRHRKLYRLHNVTQRKNYSHYYLKIAFATNAAVNFPIAFSYNVEPINEDHALLYASALLILLYVLMICEVVHRTLAALLVSTLAIALLAAHNDRPSCAEIASWIDYDTIWLLFSMMVIVAITAQTGVFNYMSVLAYKLTKGRIWPLINTLCFFTAVLSCFLDNVTTALLMTPVTIKLCEVMQLNPVPVLIHMIIYSNIGGALTPIGDPPNVIIASNPAVVQAGVTFSVFAMHMSVGVLLSMIVVHIQLRFLYRDINAFRFNEPKVQDLKREIAMLKHTAASIASYSKEEDAVRDSLRKRRCKLVKQLSSHNQQTLFYDDMSEGCDDASRCERMDAMVRDLEAQYPIRNKPLLVKCMVTLLFVIVMFFLETHPAFGRLGLPWTALLGALLLLVLAERNVDIDAILLQVEWSTLIFFASLFIIMEVLARLGLIDFIGQVTLGIVMSVGPESRLAITVLLIMWVSAFASAFVDNIPLTTMMIRIVTSLSENPELNLPLQPLVWALSFGACLGGNATLFGSSSNIICAGVAQQHGYRFSFVEFMKVGFPITITSLLITTIYLLVAHTFFTWH